MKTIKSIFVGLLAGMVFISCQKEDPKVTFLGGTAPVLAVSSTSDLVLLPGEATYSSLQFQWTNPAYEFSNGVNTQDVYYTLQIDNSDSFDNPNMALIPFTGDVMHSFKVKELDDALGQLQLTDGDPHDFYFRIKATMASNGAAVGGDVPVYSNNIKITITTYLDVVYPVPDSLFITGSASPGSWGPDGSHPLDAAHVPAQRFSKINPYTFQLTVPLTGGGSFLFVPVWHSWNNKYGNNKGSDNTNNTSGDFFIPGGNNFLAPGADGTYDIAVNFKTGKYTVTPH